MTASSLTLSSTTVANSMDNDYKIRVKDLGLLHCAVSKTGKFGGPYSVQYLHESSYVKVAREALLEAVLRINRKNCLLWELECSKSHIYVDACHDTTSGLVCLTTQLQQLFAPDTEESIVHLQNRYNKKLSPGPKCRSRNMTDGDVGKGNSTGWYGDASLRIVENHISRNKLSFIDSAGSDLKWLNLLRKQSVLAAIKGT
ncbi:hypothetical protein Ddye_024820 [Dipteronia dyeriana]|uniref:Autophagy-related protein 2 n=1 Tax=Dipteronia dyeriana TaxID=168575 RepID=A0AAD9TVR8_9ROSI|nr:hypothetical protein Ddye_024820 [Dipteronia dyeriana]